MVPKSPIIVSIPKVGAMSITKLINVSMIRPIGFLIVFKLITIEALFIFDLIMLFIDRPLPPGFHSGHEEAFTEC